MRARRLVRHRRCEAGSVSPIVIFTGVILTVLGIGGATIGRIVSARQDAQRAADAAALTAADLIREQGMQGPLADAQLLGDRNVRNNVIMWDDRVVEFNDRVIATAYVELPVEAPRFILPTGEARVHKLSRARIGQFLQAEVDWQIPKLALVLDYSGSMAASIGGGSRLDVLEQSIRDILDDGLRVEFAASFFESRLIEEATVQFDDADPLGRIRQELDRLGPLGGTCTSCGLEEAYDLFDNQPNTGFYVLLVSDGEPNDGGGAAAAQRQAERLWNDRHANIYSLHVGDGGGREFMRSVAGEPDHHPHPDYYFTASTAEQLANALRQIVASILCRVGPLDVLAVEDPDTVRVFLRNNAGIETRVEPMTNLGDNPNALGFQYDPLSGIIRMTHSACEAVSSRRDQVVVRYNHARIIE